MPRSEIEKELRKAVNRYVKSDHNEQDQALQQLASEYRMEYATVNRKLNALLIKVRYILTQSRFGMYRIIFSKYSVWCVIKSRSEYRLRIFNTKLDCRYEKCPRKFRCYRLKFLLQQHIGEQLGQPDGHGWFTWTDAELRQMGMSMVVDSYIVSSFTIINVYNTNIIFYSLELDHHKHHSFSKSQF